MDGALIIVTGILILWVVWTGRAESLSKAIKILWEGA